MPEHLRGSLRQSTGGPGGHVHDVTKKKHLVRRRWLGQESPAPDPNPVLPSPDPSVGWELSANVPVAPPRRPQPWRKTKGSVYGLMSLRSGREGCAEWVMFNHERLCEASPQGGTPPRLAEQASGPSSPASPLEARKRMPERLSRWERAELEGGHTSLPSPPPRPSLGIRLAEGPGSKPAALTGEGSGASQNRATG